MCRADVKRRSQKLEILLDIQKVRSPDAWLPCNGAVYLSVCLLGQYYRTRDKPPLFPINFSETFVIEKVFGHVFRLAELEDLLDVEVVYLELVRRPPAGPDAVLATFETSARELLFPTGTGVVRPSRSGADLDLLMEPTEHFVGSVAPRLEVATQTTVREVRTRLPPRVGSGTGVAARAASEGHAAVVVPKVLRGRPAGDRPPFRWRRPEARLIGRQLGEPPPPPPRRRRSRSGPPAGPGRGRHCHCSCPAAVRGAGSTERAPRGSAGGRAARSRSAEPLPGPVDEGSPPRSGWCAHCRTRHVVHHCSVCEAYRRYFGRGYPGHYHHDCCLCLCPVTTDGVRHVCGRPRSQSDVTDSDVTSQDSGQLAQTWRELVQRVPSSRRPSRRHQFYTELEEVYRRLYARTARPAVREALAAE